MLRALLAGLILAPAPLTSLDLHAPTPEPIRAGETLAVPLTVQVVGPAGPAPGLAGPVELSLEAPDATRCKLADRVLQPDPVTGRARTELTCRPLDPGQPRVEVVARSPPHQPGRWNDTLAVAPDRLRGSLTLDPPDQYRIPLNLSLVPQHLRKASVEIAGRADLVGSPLGFQLDPRPFTARSGVNLSTTVDALHGPGTYELSLTAQGPRVEAWNGSAKVRVPAPPSGSTLDVNVTVEAGQPSVALTADSVNDDGKHKRPGDELITRLSAEHTDAVDVAVTRRVGDTRVPLANASVPVDADGSAEHRFSHPVLPAGLVTVSVHAGNSSVARTAQIADASAAARVEGQQTVLADGRSLDLELALTDPNFGSTPADPGPVWGLPNVTWRVFRGTQIAEGFGVSIGPFEGGAEGSAATEMIPWPTGTAWATVSPGRAQMPMTLTPPTGAEPGTYRVSIYPAGDDERIGGTEVELIPPPRLRLDAPDPLPGRPWEIRLGVDDPVDGLTAELTVQAGGDPVASRSLDAAGNVSVPLPHGIAAGTTISVAANASWPGRPSTPGPDAQLERVVGALPPNVTSSPVLDGVPTSPPVAVHPAHPHDLSLSPRAWDPNGDPVTLETTVLDPSGSPTGWTADDDPTQVTIPAGVPAGRYLARVDATSQDGGTSTTVPIDVGEITRLRLDGPATLNLTEGQTTTLPLTVRNAGTVPVASLVLAPSATGPLNVTFSRAGELLPAGAPVPVDLPPGDALGVEAHVRAPPGGQGTYDLRLDVAGGAG